MTRVGRMLATILLVGTAACAGNGAFGGGPGGSATASPVPGLSASASARVLDRHQLELEQGRSVLEAIHSFLPQVNVMQAGTACPSLAMRGPHVLPGFSEPAIYLDGEPAGDTCLLEELPVDQLARVEVYPGGVTNRPGYRSNSNGLILLFSRRANDEVGAQAFRR